MKHFIWFGFAIWFFATFTACTKTETVAPAPETKTVVSTATQTVVNPDPTSCRSGVWCYDYLVRPRITKALLEADVSPICKTHSVDKNQIWLAVERGISLAESDWKYETTYEEDFIDEATGKLSISTGLFQLSYGDRNNYRNTECDLITKDNLKDPVVNVKCAMAIQNKLLTTDKRDVLSVVGRYWSVMRPTVYIKKLKKTIPNARHQVFLAEFHKNAPGCK